MGQMGEKTALKELSRDLACLAAALREFADADAKRLGRAAQEAITPRYTRG